MGLQFMLKSDACGVAVFLEGTTRSWSPIQKKKKKIMITGEQIVHLLFTILIRECL